CHPILSIRGYTASITLAMVNEQYIDWYSVDYGTIESCFLQALDLPQVAEDLAYSMGFFAAA
ncbi:MAG TPA: hypothetical protein VM260_23645, partial [Pirellula sp.]|nr:hypothetical protein [Pirellula sp.]